MKLLIIGLSGTNASGKDTVAKFFSKKGFNHFSLSDEIRKILEKEKIKATRDNLIRKGNELRKKFKPGILAQIVLRRIKDKAVVSSIRNIAEINYLKKNSYFCLIFVDAPIKLRYKRIKQREKLTDIQTFEEFKKREGKEKSKDKNKQQLDLCRKQADFIVINDKSLDKLYKKINFIINNIK